jgi:superoxide dismutase, Fe-Mn family
MDASDVPAAEGTLVNQCAADHTHAIAGGVPLLALDRYEHASGYVDAFMTNIAWQGVYERYQSAVHAASEGVACEPEDIGYALVLDVRRQGVFERAEMMIAGAERRDPEQVG